MKKIIDLGMHPYADTFIKKEEFYISEPIYPLECYLDENTGLVSLGHKTSPTERYNLYEYSYTSSNSSYSKQYWSNYALEVKEKFKKAKSILEIGSNDGYLLSHFNNYQAIGVDSSNYISNVANDQGIKTYCAIFDENFSQQFKSKYSGFDIIIANNVFNHSNDPLDFAKGVKNLLNEDGTFIFEVPYWMDTIKDYRFDQIYHEHVSYFTVKSAKNILKDCGLYIYDIKHTDYHGGSIRIYSKKKVLKPNNTVEKQILKEEREGLFDFDKYEEYMIEIKKRRSLFLNKVHSSIKKGIPIVGIGAAAKGNTFLNFCGLNSTMVEYITDSSEFKIGKFTPLSRIPILSDEEVFKKYNKVSAFFLSWNISDIIKEKLSKINSNIEFINLKN